jgi:hypothetical protein
MTQLSEVQIPSSRSNRPQTFPCRRTYSSYTVSSLTFYLLRFRSDALEVHLHQRSSLYLILLSNKLFWYSEVNTATVEAYSTRPVKRGNFCSYWLLNCRIMLRREDTIKIQPSRSISGEQLRTKKNKIELMNSWQGIMRGDRSLHYRAIFLIDLRNTVRDRRFILMSNSLSVSPCSRVAGPPHSSSHTAHRGHNRSDARLQ